MEARDMRPSDLGRLIGSKANATLILKGQRELSKAHIRKLAEFFHVSPAVFL
jgi:HTH-type transcriptional regulator/antitoxin HigA